MKRSLFLATEFEAEAFLRGAQRLDSTASTRAWTMRDNSTLVVCGMGPVHFAAGYASWLSAAPEHRLGEHVNCGIAGWLGDDFLLGRCIEVGKLRFDHGGEPSSPLLQAAWPELSCGDGATLVSVSSPVWDEERRRDLAAAGGELVDMEGYAFAAVALAHGIQPRLIKALSDPCRRRSRDEFLRDAQIALERLATALDVDRASSSR
jgi:Phosphorylase superfamily